jgi:uncharacterized phage protein (TIGR01671 family)
MREIKFRAWDKKRKEMWYPNNDEVDFYAIGMSGALYALDENGKYDYTEEFEKMIFMQFTGLKDSKGKEIYEGDIVRFYEQGYDPNEPDEERIEPETTTVLIYWNENGKCLAIDWDYEDGRIAPVGWGYVYIRNSMFDYHEVIGNIWENPELLKEAQNVQ